LSNIVDFSFDLKSARNDLSEIKFLKPP